MAFPSSCICTGRQICKGWRSDGRPNHSFACADKRPSSRWLRSCASYVTWRANAAQVCNGQSVGMLHLLCQRSVCSSRMWL